VGVSGKERARAWAAPALILAAGASKRLGTPKQLLPYRGGTLLSHAVARVHGAFDPVIVVIGAYAEHMRAALAEGPAVEVVENLEWEEGMASSIRAGTRHAQAMGEWDALLLTLVDQPLVTRAHLVEMKQKFLEARPEVIAAVYGETIGVPAIFAGSFLGKLAELRGDRGARSVVGARGVDLVRFPLEDAGFDVDRPEDMARLE
jgi:molybdenum cofactor cytidylyltransferase